MRLEVGRVHVHTWKKLKGYGHNAWRCTSAASVRQLLECEGAPDCPEPHQHTYLEEGCLAALTYVPSRKIYLFCAPGTVTVELVERPRQLYIDAAYIRHLRDFTEQITRMVENDAHIALAG